MTEHTSETDINLVLIDELDDFSKHSLQVVETSRREILLLSKTLDPALYDNDAFYQCILDLARSDRNAQVKILLKDIRPVIEQGHRILNLARRLSSKIEIRKLLIKPAKDSITYLIGDRKHLLYMHEDLIYNGFVNYAAAQESKILADEFTYLWDRHSELDPALRTMLL
ncbi:hypothetical protein JYU22_01765 [Gammaproteobacteria bacterium AH-315-E17]|nr:hypothetical protein [bacterium AH-315-I11]MBN4075289.1 hypothetical protein [Gammaproteobacteria bacterium AH-315-E17]